MNSSEKPVLLLSVIFSIAAVAVFFYLVSPFYSGADGFLEKESQFKAKTAELNNLKNYHSSVKSAYEDLKKANWEEKKEKIDVNFSSNNPMFLPKMYSFFQQKCLANGMYLDSIAGTTASKETNERIKKNQFSLSLSGSYASFKNLLADLESQVLLTSIENIGFSVQTTLLSGKKEKVVSGSMPFSLRFTVPSY